MSTIQKEIVGKSEAELIKTIHDLKEEIAKLSIEAFGTNQKDTNLISKKRKLLAVLMTELRQKKK